LHIPFSSGHPALALMLGIWVVMVQNIILVWQYVQFEELNN
jgi:hypothetical protein